MHDMDDLFFSLALLSVHGFLSLSSIALALRTASPTPPYYILEPLNTYHHTSHTRALFLSQIYPILGPYIITSNTHTERERVRERHDIPLSFPLQPDPDTIPLQLESLSWSLAGDERVRKLILNPEI